MFHVKHRHNTTILDKHRSLPKSTFTAPDPTPSRTCGLQCHTPTPTTNPLPLRATPPSPRPSSPRPWSRNNRPITTGPTAPLDPLPPRPARPGPRPARH